MKKYYEIPNYRQICATFVSPTNTLGARVKIFEPARGNDERTKYKVFSFDYEFSYVNEQAFDILQRNGMKVVARSSDKDKFIFLCNNWGENFIEIKDLK